MMESEPAHELVLATFLEFADPVGIREELARHADHVRVFAEQESLRILGA